MSEQGLGKDLAIDEVKAGLDQAAAQTAADNARAATVIAAAQAAIASGDASSLAGHLQDLGGVALSSTEAALVQGFVQAAITDRTQAATQIAALSDALKAATPAPELKAVEGGNPDAPKATDASHLTVEEGKGAGHTSPEAAELLKKLGIEQKEGGRSVA
jgi:hypothetical protein